MESPGWTYDGILSLSSPYLVRKLQRKFGIQFIDALRPSNGNVDNGAENGHSNHTYSSGEPQKSRYNLRSRKDRDENAPELEDDINDVQESVGIGKQKFVINSHFYHNLFLFGAALGNEVFYCFLWSALPWHLDNYVVRTVLLVWCLTICFGQALKELIAWPRPSSPPAAHLEDRYQLEYGMPSTHAVVGVTVPFAILYYSWERYQLEPVSLTLFVTCWCILTCTSRTYLGMHSVLDVLAGMALGAVLFVPAIILTPYLDQIFIRHQYGGVLVTALMLSICFLYPTLKQWNTSRADTYMTCAVTLGVYLADRFNFEQGSYEHCVEALPRPVSLPTLYAVLCILAKTVVGLGVLAITRQVCKIVSTKLLVALHRLDSEDPKSLQCKRFEMPYKFLVYIPICVMVISVCPTIFAQLSINPRLICHHEYFWP